MMRYPLTQLVPETNRHVCEYKSNSFEPLKGPLGVLGVSFRTSEGPNLNPFNPERCGLFWLLRMRLTVCGDCNFHANSKISISYESCGLYNLFGTLVRLLRLLVWPQEIAKVTDGKERKISFGLVNF